MKKRIFVVILIAFIGIVSVQIIGNRPGVVVKKLFKEECLFSEGKSFRYTGYFMGFLPMIEIVFEKEKEVVFEGKNAVKMKVVAKPLSPMFDFYKGRVEIESIADRKEKNALKFSELMFIPGSINEKREIFYDQKNNVIKTDGQERVMLPGTHDPVSVLYFLKEQDFNENKEFDLNVNTNQKNYQFLTKVQKKEFFSFVKGAAKVSVPAFSLDVLIKRRGKSKRKETKMTIWFLEEKSKAPFLIKIFTSGFYVVFRLTEIF